MSGWKGQSKGTPLGYKFFIWSIKLFGLAPTYAFVRFVSFYYFLFASKPKKILKEFYSSIPSLPKKKINSTIRKNFYMLGVGLVDRMASLLGKSNKLTFTNEGEYMLQEFAESHQPLVIISAHLGNWEVAGNMLRSFDKRMNAVMFDGESERLKALLEDQVGKVNYNIIAIKNDLSHVYQINNAIKQGETICIHADRFLEGAKTIEVSMFGKPVDLPYGPFQIAAKLNAHYCFIFSVKNSKYNYHFTTTVPKIEKSPQKIAEEFALLLEEKIERNPEQWFNYHQFFKSNAN